MRKIFKWFGPHSPLGPELGAALTLVTICGFIIAVSQLWLPLQAVLASLALAEIIAFIVVCWPW